MSFTVVAWQVTSESARMANVFISYRSSDGVEAGKLASELRGAGHRVWLDQWEIGLGDSIIQKMNVGLEGAAYVVVCYSSSQITSPWMGREWMSALARQLNGQGVKLLPVMLAGSTPPAILADYRHADLGRDWNQGVAELLRAIQ